MKQITSVQVLPGHKLQISFDDAISGIVDLSREAGQGMFAAWGDPSHFASVKIGHGGRSLEWPGDIDLCADALYLEITGKKAEDLFPNWQPESAHA
jgi:hypothetical protein